MNNLEQKIEAILFYKGEPVTRKFLAQFLAVGQLELNEAIEKLNNSLQGRGLIVQTKEDSLTLATDPNFSDLIEILHKDELDKGLTKATLETLSIILYNNGAHRALIDYIRGVNSSFTLRALSVRGLVEKVVDPDDSRRYLYKPTFELLSFMGVKNTDELPDYEKVRISIEQAKLGMTENNGTTEA